jgi:modulator of FtsH protease
MYLSTPNGGQMVMNALGITGGVFVGLSAYVLVSKRDFSFMGGFLMTGILVAFIAALVSLGASLFGYPMPGLALAVSAMFALLMCGLILWQTSQIINGGETNYVMATVTLYIAIYNLFTSLLHLLGVFGGDE